MSNGKRVVTNAALAACALFGLLLSAAAQQSPAPRKQPPPIPIVPLIAEYEYAPVYFMQWINDSPQYSRIAASVGNEQPPVYLVILTEKDATTASYYTNSAARAKALKAEGKDAYHTPIDYKEEKGVEQEVRFGFGFRDKLGQPVLWRFIPANSRPSERGAGLQPLGAMPGLQLRFSTRGTAAGAGTAVQIGSKVHEAEPWPQISAPPYFVAYRGSYAHGMDLSALLLGKEQWRVVKAPAELSEGAEWTLISDLGRERHLQITQRRGDEITISEKPAPGVDAATVNLNALVTPQGLALRSVALNNRANAMRITFSPDLNLTANAPAESAYQLDLGTHEKVSQGSVSVERKENVINVRWQPKSPDWAKSRSFSSTINLTADGYSIEVTQQSK
jgi:hypothetical protein